MDLKFFILLTSFCSLIGSSYGENKMDFNKIYEMSFESEKGLLNETYLHKRLDEFGIPIQIQINDKNGNKTQVKIQSSVSFESNDILKRVCDEKNGNYVLYGLLIVGEPPVNLKCTIVSASPFIVSKNITAITNSDNSIQLNLSLWFIVMIGGWLTFGKLN